MSTTSWKFVCLGKEVGDQGDLAVVCEIKEAQAGIGALRYGDFDPAGCMLPLANDPLHRDVPLIGEALCVEPDVGFPAPDLFPGLGATVDHISGEQRAERIPVPGL